MPPLQIADRLRLAPVRRASPSGVPLALPESVTVNVTSHSSATHGSQYNTGLTPLTISPRQRLDDVARQIGNLPFGGTDCALPMVEALKHRWAVDAFAQREDNPIWWLGLVAGVLMLMLAFWTSGQFFIEKAYALLAFSGIWALMHGFTDIVRAFSLRALRDGR